MSEIKTPVYQIPQGRIYSTDTEAKLADAETYVINEDHTLNDILRFLVKQAGSKEEVQTLLELLDMNNT